MKRIKLLAILSILCIILTLFSTNSFAEGEESFDLELEASSITLNPGDTFSVDIIIDNINVTSGDQGIGAYQAKIIYDENVLELVNVTAAFGWEVLENEGNMVANTSTGEVVQERTTTATINFRVKDDAEIGNIVISLESIQGSTGYTTIAGNVITEIVAVEEENNDDNNNTTGEDNTTGNDNTTGGNNSTGNDNTVGGNNSTGNDNTVSGNNTVGGNNTNTPTRNNTSISSNLDSSTTANKTLPYAGFTSIIAIAIVISIIVAIVFYIKYKRAV